MQIALQMAEIKDYACPRDHFQKGLSLEWLYLPSTFKPPFT